MNIPDYSSILGPHIEKTIKDLERQLSELGLLTSRQLAYELKQAMDLAEMGTNMPSRKLASALSSLVDISSIANEKIKFHIPEKFLKQQLGQELSSIANLGLNMETTARNLAESSIRSVQSSISILQQIQSAQFEKKYKKEIDTLQQEFDQQELDDDFFVRLFLYFREKASELPNGKIAAKGLVQIILQIITVLLLLYNISQKDKELQSNKKTVANTEKYREESLAIQKRYKENFEEFSNKLYPVLKDLAETERDEVILLVKKESPIRSKPTGNADTLMRAVKDQPIEVINTLNRWYHIKYFDDSDSTTKSGYIYKGNVQ